VLRGSGPEWAQPAQTSVGELVRKGAGDGVGADRRARRDYRFAVSTAKARLAGARAGSVDHNVPTPEDTVALHRAITDQSPTDLDRLSADRNRCPNPFDRSSSPRSDGPGPSFAH
jgi:hypothetical protein